MTQDTLQQEIEGRLQVLRDQFGETISVDRLDEIIGEVITSLHGDVNPADLRISRDLEELVNYIKTLRTEISAIGPKEIQAKYVRPSSDQLDAVVAATEEATGAILDAVERIENIAGNVTDQEMSAALGTEVNNIYEACNFQDITGQRISKVVSSLHNIEEKLWKMAAALGFDPAGGEISDTATDTPEQEDAPDPSDEKDLLNGPQLPGHATSQEEIDALLEK